MNVESLPFSLHQAVTWQTPDVGASGTFTVRKDFEQFPLVSATTETRTLARPTKAGVFCSMYVQTYGGPITLTVTGGYNVAGNTTMIFTAAYQWALFMSAYDGTNYYWELVSGTSVGNGANPQSAQLIAGTTGLVITAALHAGKIITLGTAGGLAAALQLPAATGTFNKYTFLVTATLTGGSYAIDGKPNASTFSGSVVMGSAPFPTVTTSSNLITMTGAASTTGGFVGDTLEIVDIATNVFRVTGFCCTTGSAATIFSNH